MRIVKYRLIKFAAAILVIATAIYCFRVTKTGSDCYVGSAPAPTYGVSAATPTTDQKRITDHSRPEVRIDQLLHLDYFDRFDPELASLLKPKKEGSVTRDQISTGYEQIASTTGPRKGGQNQ